jgi:hypothetical protein
MKIKLNLPGAGVSAKAVESEKADAGFSGEFDRVLAVVRRGSVGGLSEVLGDVGSVYYDFSILRRSNWCMDNVLNTMKTTRQRVLLVVGVPCNASMEITPIYVMNEMRVRFNGLAAAGLFLFDQDSAKLDLVPRSEFNEKSDENVKELIESDSLYADNCDLAGVVKVASLGMYSNVLSNPRRLFYICSDDNRLAARQRLSSYLALYANKEHSNYFPLNIVDTSVTGFSYTNLFQPVL